MSHHSRFAGGRVFTWACAVGLLSILATHAKLQAAPIYNQIPKCPDQASPPKDVCTLSGQDCDREFSKDSSSSMTMELPAEAKDLILNPIAPLSASACEVIGTQPTSCQPCANLSNIFCYFGLQDRQVSLLIRNQKVMNLCPRAVSVHLEVEEIPKGDKDSVLDLERGKFDSLFVDPTVVLEPPCPNGKC